MDPRSELLPYLLLWAGVLIYLVVRSWTARGQGVGIVLAYCFQLWLLYWVGALIHALPWAFLPDAEFVVAGFRQATFALLAFAAGSTLIGPKVAARFTSRGRSGGSTPSPLLPVAYMIAGVVSFTVLAPLLGRLPSFAALTSLGAQLILVGLCLACWRAWIAGSRRDLVKWLAASLALPATTVAAMGFLGYGAIALATLLIFVGHFFRPRWALAAFFAVASYLGLSLYVNYMTGRGAIRASVWGEESYSNRIDTILGVFENAEWFDPANPEHLGAIDGRLNQNALVGAATAQLAVTQDFARGETIWMGILAMIPRIIWPDKPMRAGSGDLVTRFTGIEFAEGTSVGIGPVMELYANFGSTGVWVGFLVIGAIVGALDRLAGVHLRSGNWHGFAVYFLVAIAFLNVTGSFVEVAAGSMAAIAVGHLAKWALNRYQSKGRRAPALASPRFEG